MKHRLFKCGTLSGMLLGAAALLAMVPLMSVPALAEEPGAAYAASSARRCQTQTAWISPYGELLELLR